MFQLIYFRSITEQEHKALSVKLIMISQTSIYINLPCWVLIQMVEFIKDVISSRAKSFSPVNLKKILFR